MLYADQLRHDVERILQELVRKCERKADCDKCGSDDVSISGKSSFVSSYAREITDLIKRKVGA